jgi:hypothetical protein
LPGVNATRELAVLGNAHASNDQLLNALFKILGKVEKAATI